jgi:hypothetical protein
MQIILLLFIHCHDFSVEDEDISNQLQKLLAQTLMNLLNYQVFSLCLSYKSHYELLTLYY